MKRTWLADVCLLLVALIWGSTFLVVQYAVHTLPPLAFNAIRFVCAGLLFAVVLLLTRRTLTIFLNKRLLLHGGILGLWLFSAYAFGPFHYLMAVEAAADSPDLDLRSACSLRAVFACFQWWSG
ncbi:EamA family transporter [Paenibacillus sp. E194]|uniref:EamA family transporter n=1 Tax=Paenibacillus sp. E194 TaxID=1458845 RepID=UPI001E64642A|nr:EamA family transporter [Paenibacillus sp. E194]